MPPCDRRAFLGLSAGLAAALPSSLALAATHGPPTQTPVRIGAMLPDSGAAAPLGAAEQRGIAFAIREQGTLDGMHIALHVHDFPTTSPPFLHTFYKLAHVEGTYAILTGHPGPVIGLAQPATKYTRLLVNAGDQTDQLADVSPYLINTIPPVKDEIRVLVPFVIDTLKHKHAAVLCTNSAAGLSARNDFVGAFTAAGGKIVGDQKVAPRTADFRAALSAFLTEKPPLLFAAVTAGSKDLAVQMRGLGLAMPVVGTTSLATPATVLEPAANGWYHTQIPIPAPSRLATDFARAFPAEPFSFYTRQYYYATAMVLAAYRKLVAEKRALSSHTLRVAILGTKDFPGILPLDSNGNVTASEIAIVRIENGKQKLLKRVTHA